MNELKNTPFDKELSPGAYNAINVCLNLQPGEKLILITDEATLEIAASLITEVEKIGAECRVFVLEDCANRPLKRMPEIILHNLARANVSIYADFNSTGRAAGPHGDDKYC